MWKQAIISAIVTSLIYKTITFALGLGVFQNTYNHAPGPCKRLVGIEHGSEDIEVLTNGLAFISSGLKLTQDNSHRKTSVGQIFLFDFNKPDIPPQALPIDWSGDAKTINPHGISLWTNINSDAVNLYVISHHCPGECVDKFLFDENSRTLKHRRRIENQTNFHIINDLKVVGEDEFYFTNWLYWNNKVESYLSLHWGSVGYFNGNSADILVKNLARPNGINLSPDGRLLYLAHIGGRELQVYERHSDDSITFLESTKLWTSPDNLDVNEETGDIWIGAHPVRYKVTQYLDNPDKHHSPSQVLRLKMVDGRVQDVREVYSNDGSELSGSSVAVKHKNAYLVGSVATHCLYCQISSQTIKEPRRETDSSALKQ